MLYGKRFIDSQLVGRRLGYFPLGLYALGRCVLSCWLTGGMLSIVEKSPYREDEEETTLEPHIYASARCNHLHLSSIR